MSEKFTPQMVDDWLDVVLKALGAASDVGIAYATATQIAPQYFPGFMGFVSNPAAEKGQVSATPSVAAITSITAAANAVYSQASADVQSAIQTLNNYNAAVDKTINGAVVSAYNTVVAWLSGL